MRTAMTVIHLGDSLMFLYGLLGGYSSRCVIFERIERRIIIYDSLICSERLQTREHCSISVSSLVSSGRYTAQSQLIAGLRPWCAHSHFAAGQLHTRGNIRTHCPALDITPRSSNHTHVQSTCIADTSSLCSHDEESLEAYRYTFHGRNVHFRTPRGSTVAETMPQPVYLYPLLDIVPQQQKMVVQ
jgi:hypothetical protein